MKGEPGERPKGELKEIKEGQGDSGSGAEGVKAVLVAAKTVVSASKNIQNRLKVFQLSGKAFAAPGRRWNGLARVSIDAFNCKGVMFVVDIEDMPSLYIMTTVSRKPRQIPGIS